jgi:hypothetical protein
MPSQHKHPPVSFRPPETDRLWLFTYAKTAGKAVNAVLAEALAAYRAEKERDRL